MTDILIKKVRLIDPSHHIDQVIDLCLSDGKIKDFSPQLNLSDYNLKIIDGNGLILGTGLVDLYSHSGETGHEERETLNSLAQAAIAGGYTRLTILPDTLPNIDHPAQVSLLSNKAPELPKLSFWGNISLGGKSEKMVELVELAEAGVIGFTDHTGLKNLPMLRRVLEYVQPLNKPVMLKPIDPAFQGNGVMREGATSLRFGLPSVPEFCETIAINTICELVKEFSTPVHLMNLSTKKGVELLSQAKAQNLPITASVSWMHLILNTEDLINYNPNLRLNPPLGNPWDQEALKEGLKTGVIDAIAVDHTPYTYEEKTVAFGEAPCGAIGLELILPLLWSKLVETGEFSPLELWQKMSYNPAILLQQKPPSIRIGEKAELVLFDPQKTWLVNQENLQSISHNTYWLNQEVKGKVIPLNY